MKKKKIFYSDEEVEKLKTAVIEQLIFLMKVKKIRKKHISPTVGLSEAFLSKVTNMKISPSLESLVKIADVSGCKIIVVNKNQ